MTKTFRRALACLLAVLMVAFSMPFTALAAQLNREWWTDDGVDPSTITEEPRYVGYNDDRQELGSWEFGFAQKIELGTAEANNNGWEDHRDDYKPIIAVIVSSQGDASITKENYAEYYNTFYGYDTSRTYDVVKAAGNILNPADLKAGQRIAVTVEFGGFDVINCGQFKGDYNPDYLKVAWYPSQPFAGRNGSDTWVELNGDNVGVIGTGGTMGSAAYGRAFQLFSGYVDTSINEWAGSICSGAFGTTGSTFIGTGTMNSVGSRDFGKYGITSFTYSFEVLQDCDLSEVFTFRGGIDGTIFEPYERTQIAAIDGNADKNVGKYLITMDDSELTFAKCAPVIWDSYDAGSTPEPAEHVHDYQLTGTTDATCTEDAVEHYTCTNEDGLCDELTKDVTLEDTALGHNFKGDVTSLNNGKHTVACTRCDAFETVDCSYTEKTIGADCTKPGTIVYTCDCGYSYETSTGTALGHDFENGAVISNTVTKEATCEEDGVRTIVTQCSRCDETQTTTEAIAATGHDWNTTGTVTKAATCKDTGIMVVTCKNDATHTKEVEIPVDADNHVGTTSIVGAVAATCAKDGYTGDVVCDDCGAVLETGSVIAKETVAHTPVLDESTAVAATYDAAGKEADTVCSVCGATLEVGKEIPMLVGIQVTVAPSALGTATVKGLAVEDEAVTANCAPNSDVVLTATPVEGAVFAGWNVDGKLVATDATITVKALADITYVPVFQAAAEKFTVVFADRYGNVFAAQDVTSGAEVDFDAVKAPTVAGYTFTGWSVTAEEITGPTTIQAVYEKNEDAGYTVTADGCTITAGDVEAANTLEGVAYDTLVTVTADGAKAWTINGATVAYGESYTFYVGSDVTVVPVFDAVTATPTVAAVSVTEITDGAKIKASFLATRSMTDDCKYVAAGFVYGKNLDNDEITLDDVKAGSAVKAYYCATDAEQFALTYSLAAQQGKMTARAFLAYTNAQGETVVIYAEPQTYTYA